MWNADLVCKVGQFPISNCWAVIKFYFSARESTHIRSTVDFPSSHLLIASLKVDLSLLCLSVCCAPVIGSKGAGLGLGLGQGAKAGARG